MARGVNGISTATKPEPRPMTFSTSVRASFSVTPIDFRTFAEIPVDSPISPSKICSVPTKLWPSRRDSSWASMTTLMAFSVKRSNIIVVRPRCPADPEERSLRRTERMKASAVLCCPILSRQLTARPPTTA